MAVENGWTKEVNDVVRDGISTSKLGLRWNLRDDHDEKVFSTRLDKFSCGCAESQVQPTKHPFPVSDALRQRFLASTCGNANLDPLRLPQVQLLAHCLLALAGRECEHPFCSSSCSFPQNHRKWSGPSFPNDPSRSDRARFPQFQHSALVLVLFFVLGLALLCSLSLLPLPFALDVLAPAFPARTHIHGSSRRGCDGPSVISMPLHSQYVLISSLKTSYDVTVSHGSTENVSRFSSNRASSELMRPQECVHCLGHIVYHSGVSRDLPSFRWHPSASLAVVTGSLSGDFVHVPPCTGPNSCATCANSRSLDRLLLTSQR